MKLSLRLGLFAPKRTVYWWSLITDFPKFVLYKNHKFEFAGYKDDPAGQVAYLCYFSEVYKSDANYNENYTNIDYLFNKDGNLNDCDCGAEFSSFPWDHMRFCRLWKHW